MSDFKPGDCNNNTVCAKLASCEQRDFVRLRTTVLKRWENAVSKLAYKLRAELCVRKTEAVEPLFFGYFYEDARNARKRVKKQKGLQTKPNAPKAK